MVRRRYDDLELELHADEVQEPLNGAPAPDHDEPAAHRPRVARGGNEPAKYAAGDEAHCAQVDDHECGGAAVIEQQLELWLGGEVELALE